MANPYIKQFLVSFITRLNQCDHIKTSLSSEVVFFMLVVDPFPNLDHYKNDL